MALTVATYTGQPATSHAVNLPSVPAGTKVLLFVTAGANITTPTGWTSVASSTGQEALACYERVFTGSEGSTLTVAIAASRALAAIAVGDPLIGATTGTQQAGAYSQSTITLTGIAITPTPDARLYSAFARAATTITAGLSGTWGASFTEAGDVALDATSNEDPWLTVGYRDVAGGSAYTPQVVTSAAAPAPVGRTLTLAYTPDPNAGWTWAVDARVG